ncbi:MAG: YgfZ/GcvT domain-containing protein [Xenococcaceae cyanobacterium]
MMEDLRKVQTEAGAIFERDIPVSFNNDRIALQAASEGIALYDRSHWGIIKISGGDRLRYLHNQSTNDFQALKPGQGCETVFVNSTARTIDLTTAYVTEDAVLILVSPHRRQKLMEWLDRFIFPMDKVELTDVSTDYAVFNLIGKQSDRLLQELGMDAIIDRRINNHQAIDSLRLAVGNGLAIPGYTFIVPVAESASIWSKLTAGGAIPLGDLLWEQLRIQQGRPTPDRELTEDYNPLEAGLWQTISFSKGCYIGQETIARLNTYKGVKQRLWGVKLDAPVEPNTTVTLENDKVGILTSYTDTENGSFGLAYIRTKAGGAGLKVKVGNASGELVAVPYLSHQYFENRE